MKVIRIILADDHPIMRSGLKSIIQKNSGMAVVGEADNGMQAVELTKKLLPDIIIMDISMPDMNGIEAARIIKLSNSDIKILTLSVYMEREYVMGMFSAGASGFLIKDCAESELIEAIKVTLNGGTYISREITGIVVNELKEALGAHDKSSLSEREKEILTLIAAGLSTRDIAGKLFLSVKTVESHRHNIMEKLGLFSIAELTKYAIKNGLSSL